MMMMMMREREKISFHPSVVCVQNFLVPVKGIRREGEDEGADRRMLPLITGNGNSASVWHANSRNQKEEDEDDKDDWDARK